MILSRLDLVAGGAALALLLPASGPGEGCSLAPFPTVRDSTATYVEGDALPDAVLAGGDLLNGLAAERIPPDRFMAR